MLGAMLQLGVAALLMALLIVGAIIYATLVARRRGWWCAPLAIAFALGWLVFLPPFALAFFYASPWDLTLRGKDVYANLDLCELVGFILILGYLIAETAPGFAPKNWRKPIEERFDRFVLIGLVIVCWGMTAGEHFSSDYFIRTTPDYAAQEAGVWWFGLALMLIGMTLLVMAQRAQRQRAVTSSAMDGAN